MEEYLEIRVVEYNIFRILIVDSNGPPLPFRPITRLRWLEGARARSPFIEGENRQSRKYDRRDLSERKERIQWTTSRSSDRFQTAAGS